MRILETEIVEQKQKLKNRERNRTTDVLRGAIVVNL